MKKILFLSLFLVIISVPINVSAQQTCQWPQAGVTPVYPLCQGTPGTGGTTSTGAAVYQPPTLTPVPACSKDPNPWVANSSACIALLLSTQQSNMAALDAANRAVFLANCNSAWAANDARYSQLGLTRPPNNCANIYGNPTSTSGGGASAFPTPTQTIGGVTVPAQFSGNQTLNNSTGFINSVLGQVDSVCASLATANSNSSLVSLQGTLCSNSAFKNFIRDAYAQQIRSFTTVLSPSYGTTPVVGSGVGNTGGANNTVTVTSGPVNIRSTPNSNGASLGTIANGAQFNASCYVIGLNVSGNDKWWKTASGTYVWSGGTGGVGGAPLCTGSTNPVVVNPLDNQSIGWPFRTLRLTITTPGPISIREVEIYNTAGTKLSAGKIRASSNVADANKMLDGDPNTAWTLASPSMPTSGCNGCGPGLNVAWVVFDLDIGQGSAQDVSRVKVMPGNSNTSGTIQAMVTAAGADDPTGGLNQYTYQPLGSYMAYPDTFLVSGITTPVDTWTAPFTDRQFLQYPPVSYAADPTINLTVNGQKSKDVRKSAGVSGEKIIHNWTSTNADYVIITGSAVKDPSVTSTLSASEQSICDASNQSAIRDSFTMRGAAMPVNGSSEGTYYYSGCANYIITYTITAGQRYTGRTKTDTITVKLVP